MILDEETTELPSESARYHAAPFDDAFWRRAFAAPDDFSDDIEPLHDDGIGWQDVSPNGSRWLKVA